MRATIEPPNELERMHALQLLGILDTPTEKSFDQIAKAVAAICETPIALVTFVDKDRQWFKASIGLDIKETSRDVAFCAHAILNPKELLEVEDATLDDRFRDNPLVTGAPNIRFYAGVPLTSKEGLGLGTLCVIDQKPRILTQPQRDTLRELGGALASLLDERRNSSAMSIAIENNMRHGILVTDARQADHRIVYANQGLETLTRYSREDVIGKSYSSFLTDDENKAVHQEFQQAISIGQERSVTVKSWRKDGSFFWNELTITPVHNPVGEITHYVHIHSDVTSSYLAEQSLKETRESLEQRVQMRTTELRDSEQRYRELFENAGDLIHCVDMDGKFVYVNPAWHEAMGYSNEDLAGLTMFDILHPDHHEECLERLSRAMAGEPVGTIETVFITRSGESLLVEGSVNCQLRDGKPIAARGIFHNITARVAAAESLKQAKEVAENAAEAQSKFLAAASHDLRQPLAAIGIYLAVLERQLHDPKDLQVSGQIRQSLNATRELLDALLDISMLRSGAVQPTPEEFSPHKMFEELRASSEPQAEQKGLSLHFELPQCSICSDPALLKRILENLIVNAIRYTEKGRVDVRCINKGDVALIEVEDTGIGIATENLDDIFGEYIQLNNDVRDRRKGLGLGLSIVKYVSTLLGHNITATSTPGVGSCFVVEVPVGGHFPYEDPQPYLTDSTDSDRSLRLLLVEDDPTILAANEMLFSAVGHSVYVAKDSEEALALLADGLKPDVLVSDYRLPFMNGVQLTGKVREILDDELPVVFMTGDTSITTAGIENCEVLHKPVDSNMLLALLQTVARP